jgi:E3 ubiquitin-protein ligase BRE1
LESQEQKAAFLERISDLKRTISRLERGLASESLDVIQRLEAQEKENETLLGEMGNMESELTRVQQENTRLLRQLAESEESRLHHTLERASWTKAQQGASKKSEIEKEKTAKLEERMKFQETTLQQMQAKIANLEQQLRIKSDTLSLLQQRCDTNEKANGDVVLLAHDLQQRLEEMHAALQQYQNKFSSEMESKEALQKDFLAMKEELAISNNRRGGKGGTSGGKGGGTSGDSYLEQQMESYKKALRCSVCNDRNKNTVITRCYHCFCKECVEDNLEKRIRKCPVCSASFGDKDVHALWF